MILVKQRFIIRHKSGYFINVRYEPARDIDTAARFGTEEEAGRFYRDSHYKAPDPENYTIVPIRITYQLEEDKGDEQSSLVSKDS